MKCLTDSQIQALADREASADAVAHAAGCARCAGRVQEQGRRMAVLERAVAERMPMPDAAAERVQHAILTDRGTRGATRLRQTTPRAPAWRRAGWSTAAGLVIAVVTLVFVVPAIRGPQTVSAAEILAKSVSTLASADTGIEFREYELVLDGMPRELMPDQANGTYRIQQAIDHGTKGRFRFASYTADGRLLTSLAQDPVTRTRVSLMRVDDRYYRFEFAMPASDVPSVPEIERLHMEASVAMMQASGQQLLQEVDTPHGKQYRVEVPQVNTANVNAVWDLTQARVVIDAEDFRIQEFFASGTFLRQPYSVSYKLLDRVVAATAAPDAFVVPEQPGQIVISGQGSANPAADALIGALRELARSRR